MNFEQLTRALLCAALVPAFFAAGCRTSGDSGELEGTVSITVTEGEIISGRMLPVVGSVLEADITALNGDGRCSYEWYKDNQRINGADQKTYTVDVKDRKAGIIEVRVSREGFNGTQSGLLSGPFSGGGPLGEATSVPLGIVGTEDDDDIYVKQIVYSGKSKTWLISVNDEEVWRSADNGATWQKSGFTRDDGNTRHSVLTSVNDKFFISTDTSSTYGTSVFTYVSDDGITWTELKIGGNAFGLRALVSDGVKFYGLNDNNTGVSNDGLSWTLTPNPDGNFVQWDKPKIIYADGRFWFYKGLAFEEGIKSSTDCFNWQLKGDSLSSLAYHDGLWVLIKSNNALLWTEDSKVLDLTDMSEALTDGKLNFAIPTLEEFIASGGAASFPGEVVVYAPECERWLAVGWNGAAAESYDGKTWRPYQTGTEKNLISAVFGGGRWMVGTDDGGILYFDDPMYVEE